MDHCHLFIHSWVLFTKTSHPQISVKRSRDTHTSAHCTHTHKEQQQQLIQNALHLANCLDRHRCQQDQRPLEKELQGTRRVSRESQQQWGFLRPATNRGARSWDDRRAMFSKRLPSLQTMEGSLPKRQQQWPCKLRTTTNKIRLWLVTNLVCEGKGFASPLFEKRRTASV